MNCESVKPYNGDNRPKGNQVEEMFDNIAPAYDFMNSAMSFGLHRRWLAKALEVIGRYSPEGPWLDLATGTADVAISLASLRPDVAITGIDLSEGMLAIGRRKVEAAGLSDRISLIKGDCLNLPFPDSSAGLVTIAYGVRNFEHLERGLREICRVLRPGGMLVMIELSVPKSLLIKPFYYLYTRTLIPLVGRLKSHDVRAYSYLPESIAAVPQRSDMTELIDNSGFAGSGFKSMTLGACTLYTAFK